ncbi:hypothetical protein JYU34_014240 [Plutella xylostella]|uniref:Dendritic cell-specific transmembrane protein-like domain-containing protein n=1 Tax=Plutella xylostella TaxID=51655 RepID=A0ABQ7Q882_PLUXY|nr:hypothetical protein JYU34_014240 [Plutella xylostella]
MGFLGLTNLYLSCRAELCSLLFSSALQRCTDALPEALRVVCGPLRAAYHCDLLWLLGARPCDSRGQIDPGLGEGYEYLKRSKDYLTGDFRDVKLQYKVAAVHELNDVQDAKETGLRVIHAFEEKHNIMRIIYVVLNVCLALLCLRIVSAAITYHEMYLTSIEYDNLYVTGYFKKIDQRRAERRKHSLLPLKKMERSRYIDIHSLKYISIERQKLVNRMLKVMLEMITATTFVMLDRLFYEALAVVRAHAERGAAEQGDHDLEINVEGSGMVASLLRRVLSGLATHARVTRSVSNRECLPRPHPLSPLYYFYIYGGYLWIVLLLYFSAYTHRLSRLICSYFYPRREKQRILHLYNDILKKRMKLDKTLRKTAVQAVRAYYLSGENLLSLRMRFPRLLGWLSVLPAARMKCLVCGETEPSEEPEEPWHACSVPKCPFLYCAECWRDAGAACLACDPRLAELSDVDSLSEDDVRIK